MLGRDGGHRDEGFEGSERRKMGGGIDTMIWLLKGDGRKGGLVEMESSE